MKVLRAESMGFCFGVRDALEAVRDIADPSETTIYGDLVHNQTVLTELDERGFRRMLEGDRDVTPATDHVLVTAHGISDRRRRSLASAGKTVIDTTCPLVTRAHDAAIDLARRGHHVVVVGRRDHVEVAGIVEDLPGHDIVESVDDVKNLGREKIGIVFQTTTPVDRADEILDRLRTLNPDAEIEVVDTICAPTKDRQSALGRLLQRVSAVIVIGGRNSNNTLRLVARCRDAGAVAFHVTGPDDLDMEALSAFDVVGVTAGTSTPDEVIDAVCTALADS